MFIDNALNPNNLANSSMYTVTVCIEQPSYTGCYKMATKDMAIVFLC